MLPAHERLHAAHPAGAHVHLGLVVHDELPPDGAVQRTLELEPFVGLLVEPRGVHGVGVPPFVLGAVHGGVGVLQQRVRLEAVPRVDGDTDAGRDGGGPPEHRTDAADEPVGRGVRHVAVGLGHQHPELVASQPAHDVRLAQGAAHRVGHEPQHGVACGVAVRIVDVFEVVQVEVDQGQGPAVAPVAAQLLRQLVRERPRIQHVRERVLDRELLELRVRVPQLRQAGDGHPDHRQVRELVQNAVVDQRRRGQLVDADAEAQETGRQCEGDAPMHPVVPGREEDGNDEEDVQPQLARRPQVQEIHAPDEGGPPEQSQRAEQARAGGH